MVIKVGNKKNNKLVGTDGDDELYGKGGDDKLFGLAGADLLEGGKGDDTLEGGAGADVLHGGKGINTLSYKSSSAAVYVDLANDGSIKVALGGDAQGDTGTGFTNIIGSSFDDELVGNRDDNLIVGRGGDDFLVGLAGNDTLKGGGGDDFLYAGDGKDIAKGGAGRDFLYGENGNDKLYGGKGDDFLVGGKGNDKLYGGKGDDTFYFQLPFGKDTIYDFKAGAGSDDVIIFDVGIFADFAAVKAAAKNKDYGVLIKYDDNNSIKIMDVKKQDLHEDDFLFV